MTRQGKHGTLFCYRISYRDEDPCCPTFTCRVWAYSREHAEEKWLEDCDGWRLLSIERVF